MSSLSYHELGLIPSHLFENDALMRVPSVARRSVVFIGNLLPGGAFRPRATGFLVQTFDDETSEFMFPYLVTAEHVVSGLLCAGEEIYCRLNTKDGKTLILPLPQDGWFYHPEAGHTDVAVRAFTESTDTIDHDFIPLLPENHRFRRGLPDFGLGDEIFIMGLFRSHHGQQRNVPIIRIGNIAAMPEEKIYTNYCGFMDAYLVELRSIAGLSGSPAFVNIAPLSSDPSLHPDSVMPRLRRKPNSVPMPTFSRFRQPEPEFELVTQGRKRDPEELRWLNYEFLGLVHGHFDSKDLSEDTTIDGIGAPGINTGIGIIVPASKIRETIFQPELAEIRAETEKELRKRSAAVPD